MSKFGWSYPAGCSGPPDEERPMNPLTEEALVILDGELDDRARERLTKIIEDLDSELYYHVHRECQRCLDENAKERDVDKR